MIQLVLYNLSNGNTKKVSLYLPGSAAKTIVVFLWREKKWFQHIGVALCIKPCFRSQLPDVCRPATSPGLHPVDHHSFWPEGNQLHHHHPLQKRALRFQGPDHHLQSLQQALTDHRPSAAPGSRCRFFTASIHQSGWLNHLINMIRVHICF